MNRLGFNIATGFFLLVVSTAWLRPAGAQDMQPKPKPPLYTYTENWNIPRARWGEMDKKDALDVKILDKALGEGILVGHGDDQNAIHVAEEFTHDQWWSAMSISALVDVLEQLERTAGPNSPIMDSGTKHWDSLYVSRYYNWRSGKWSGVYTHGASYTLKPAAASDSVDALSTQFIVPVLEKLFLDGTIREYEIDTEAIHTESPATFWVFYVTASSGGLDKVEAALTEELKVNPLAKLAVDSVVDFTPHRDFLAHTNATYK